MNIKTVIGISMLTLLLLLPSTSIAQKTLNDDFEIAIRGGFGIHIKVINNREYDLIVNITVITRNHNTNGVTGYPPGETNHNDIILAIFTPVTIIMEAEEKSVERKGICFMGFVIFFTNVHSP